MKRVILALALLFLAAGAAHGQTDTPTATATATPTITNTPTVTPTPTSTPTITPVVSTQVLAILVNDGSAEACWQYSGSLGQLEIRNIGSNSMTIKETQGISETSPATPTTTDGEIILPAGVATRLRAGRKMFCYRAGSSATTSLSVSVSESVRP